MVRRFREAARGDDAVALLDGEHLVTDALAAGVPFEVVLADGRMTTLAEKLRAAGATVHDAATTVIEAASPVRTPDGIVALARWRVADLGSVLETLKGSALGLVGVQDPGNVGSAIRAADAIGAAAVLALDETADPRSWKALRGSMGSAFHLPVARGSSTDALAQARRLGLSIVATVAVGGTDIARADLSKPSLILVGSEGAGLPADIISLADQRVTVPMRPVANSLNVAVTAGILLYEMRRQQTGRGKSG